MLNAMGKRIKAASSEELDRIFNQADADVMGELVDAISTRIDLVRGFAWSGG
jgi:hypothetical protein